jgi:integrase
LARAALLTGCRYGELIRLTVGDFRVATDGKGNAKGTIAITRSKTGTARHVILTDEGILFLREATLGRAGDALIFTRATGQPWKASQQGRFMRQTSARAKLAPPISFHGLRHTWASLSVMNGMPLMVVAMNLGHADTRMVERVYGHLSNDFINDAIRSSGPRFGFQSTANVLHLR